jgi:2-polyprenyl-6-methoxyphenol hydroxylase-like FAD-dependent oxidoreductase
MPARRCLFADPTGRLSAHWRPHALCLSRLKLDALLAETFQQTGGELRVHARWTKAEAVEGLVFAAGRRTQPAETSPRWFGVKAHVPRPGAVPLEADLEMHAMQDGYIGVNRINDGGVNVCGLFRVREDGQRTESKQAWLRGDPGSLLRERLRLAEFDPDSFCSVAGLQLRPQRAAARAECCIGDRLTMTPPVTGNGMSMAFESAELAVAPLGDYSQGRLDWAGARRRLAQSCDAAFARRLRWARRLQWMMLAPALQGRLGTVLLRSEWLWRFLFARTRE